MFSSPVLGDTYHECVSAVVVCRKFLGNFLLGEIKAQNYSSDESISPDMY